MFKLSPPEDDGLFIPSVKEWSKDKHYYLLHYINAFTTAMKDKKWAGLHYIDLFAGAGIERIEDSQELEWGSPLIASQSPNPFAGLHLCEFNEQKYSVLKERVFKFRQNAQILHGDANEQIHAILKEIPRNTLSLAFLDPYGLHLDYDTLELLSNRRADLIIFFPDHLDALRNWELNYFDNPDSNLDRCLGHGSDWRSIIQDTPRERLAEKLKQLYVEQIGKLGYTQFEYIRIRMRNGHPLYLLIFCSRHPVAAKIWRGISAKDPDGQRTFKFQDD